MQKTLEQLRKQYLTLCQAKGVTPRDCLERYPAPHLEYFISQLQLNNASTEH